MRKVVVIGSNSFSGSDFIDHLLEVGGYEVLGISRSKEKDPLFLPYKRHGRDHFTFFQADLNKDLDALEQKFDAFQPDYIVNFAAQSEVAPSWVNPADWFQTNAVAITGLANMLKDKIYLKKYVHISSPEVYGHCEGNVTEEAPVNPSTPYAASKAAGDLSLFTFAKNCHFPLVMVRATNVYGSHQQLFKIIPRTIIYLKQGKKIQLHGGGVAVKSYIHIRDVSCGERLIMEKGKIGEIYHLSPSKGVSVKEVVETICCELGLKFEDCTEAVSERLGQDKAYVIDSTKATKQLSWTPKISLIEGIRQAICHINAHFSDIQKEPLEYIHKA
ncbi:MAG: GDP-mannose 4,6-dehydratase [Simkaniaceae bacterium]|nr:GDP-mannose 4,6-dehydratase [Simkaniaceae bacterium]